MNLGLETTLEYSLPNDPTLR